MTNATTEDRNAGSNMERIALEILKLARAAAERLPAGAAMPGLDELETMVRRCRGEVYFFTLKLFLEGKRFGEVELEHRDGRWNLSVSHWSGSGDAANALLKSQALAVAAQLAQDIEEMTTRD